MSGLTKTICISFLLAMVTACGPDSKVATPELDDNVAGIAPSPDPTPDPDQPDVEPAPEPDSAIQVELQWQAPTERLNGLILDENEIETYEVSYIDPQGDIQLHSVTAPARSWKANLAEGEYTFTVQSIDDNGLKGETSAPVKCDISSSLISCG